MGEMKMMGRSMWFGVLTLVFAVGGLIAAAMAYNASSDFGAGVFVLGITFFAWFYIAFKPYIRNGQGYAREARDRQMAVYMGLGAEDRRRQIEMADDYDNPFQR